MFSTAHMYSVKSANNCLPNQIGIPHASILFTQHYNHTFKSVSGSRTSLYVEVIIFQLAYLGRISGWQTLCASKYRRYCVGMCCTRYTLSSVASGLWGSHVGEFIVCVYVCLLRECVYRTKGVNIHNQGTMAHSRIRRSSNACECMLRFRGVNTLCSMQASIRVCVRRPLCVVFTCQHIRTPALNIVDMIADYTFRARL